MSQSVAEQERDLAALRHEIALLQDELRPTAPHVAYCKHHPSRIVLPADARLVHVHGRCCYCGEIFPTRKVDKGLVTAQFLMALLMALLWAFLGTLGGGMTVWLVTGLFNIMVMALGFPSMFQAGYFDLFPAVTLMFRLGAILGCVLGLLGGFIGGACMPWREKADGRSFFSRGN